MTRLWLGLALLAAAGCGDAPPGEEKTASIPGTVYGEGVATLETTKISELTRSVDRYAGKRVRVEGLVTDVCAKRGCWFRMASDKEFETLRFKVKDGVMVFPMSAKGKYAVADGVVRRIPLDLEQTRRYLAHLAEDRGEPFDPGSVTEPVTLIQLDGVGAVIRDAR